jgi:hypothetical protein
MSTQSSQLGARQDHQLMEGGMSHRARLAILFAGVTGICPALSRARRRSFTGNISLQFESVPTA